MEIEKWLPYYDAIVADLSIDRERDELSGRMLSEMISSSGSMEPRARTLQEVQDMISGRPVYVFGAGPDLEDELGRLLSETGDEWVAGTRDEVLIAADGATSTLLSLGLRPDVIVTDLDGSPEDQARCLRDGSIMFVHAHGDNMEVLSSIVPGLSGKVIGTTQADPARSGYLDNFGGLTDGDRAAFIAQHFGAGQIVLFGFDFNEVGEKIGEGGDRRVLSEEEEKWKFKKLTWAFALLGLLTRPQVRPYSQNYPLSMGPL